MGKQAVEGDFVLEQCAAPGPRTCAAEIVDPRKIITAPMATQADTLRGIVKKRVWGMDVPLYHFQQPARLSSLELPFKLLLLRDVPLEGIHELTVDPREAMDSWFVGYTWTIVVCERCDGVTHLGWRFTSTSDGSNFFALIVDYKDDENEKVRSLSAVMEAVAEQLTIGM